jgi:hypothetical protein
MERRTNNLRMFLIVCLFMVVGVTLQAQPPASLSARDFAPGPGVSEAVDDPVTLARLRLEAASAANDAAALEQAENELQALLAQPPQQQVEQPTEPTGEPRDGGEPRAGCFGDVEVNGGSTGFTNSYYMFGTQYFATPTSCTAKRRTETIYLAGDLGCPDGGTITALRYYVVAAPTLNPLTRFTIRLRHTQNSSYPDPISFSNDGWTQVYQADTSITAAGWYTFAITPFVYNGRDNLEVDTSFNNASNPTVSGGTSHFFSCGITNCNRALRASGSAAHSDPLTWTSTNPTTSRGGDVPRAQFVFSTPGTAVCCLNDAGSCQVLSAADCASAGGVFHPEAISCADFTCPTTWWVELLDSNPGWTISGGEWQFAAPQGLCNGNDPTIARTGTNVYGYDLTGSGTYLGCYERNIPEYYLTTNAIDCTGKTNVRLRFWRWLSIYDAGSDHAAIRVSNDNTNWTNVWLHELPAFNDTSWTQVAYDLPNAVCAGRSTVYVRWVMGPVSSGVGNQKGGWNIDDVELLAATTTLGACCDTQGGCLMTTAGNCVAPSVWRGAGIPCTPNPCVGACCTNSGCSLVAGAAACSGTYQGDGTTCPSSCALPGACCTPNGTCYMSTATAPGNCASGDLYRGDNTTCTLPCPPWNDECVRATPIGNSTSLPFNCLNATTSTVGTHSIVKDIWFCYTATCNKTIDFSLCGTDWDTRLAVWDGCTCPPTTELAYNNDAGAGCTPNTTASKVTLVVTAGHQYLIQIGGASSSGSIPGPGVLTVTCPPTGACCFSPTSCQILAQDDCANSGGTYSGDNVPCTPSPCSRGACCTSTGCAVTSEAQCNGTFLGNGTTCPSTCPLPGACCYPNGTCQMATVLGQCLDTDGVYQGDNTTCGTASCAQPGACCDGMTCYMSTVVFPGNCSQGGTYLGDGTSCTPNPCFGACCYAYPNVTCVTTVSELDCLSMYGGTWHVGQNCNTYTCPGYCTATSACGEYISRVQLTMGDTVLIDNLSACSSGGYADYTATSAALYQPYTYTLTVTNGYPVFSADQCKFWIDWNGNGLFTDAGEEYVMTGSPGVGPYSATFTPATTGPKRMRVRVSYAFYTPVVPCGSAGGWGEAEDYTLMVAASPPQEGACCYGTGCQITTAENCAGTFHGPGTACTPFDPCTGACCLQSGMCVQRTFAACAELNGTFHGDNVPCSAGLCAIPQDCGAGTLLSQAIIPPTGDWEFPVSDVRYVVFDNYAANTPICDLQWYGLDVGLVGGTWTECDQICPTFEIAFWTDDGTGHPDLSAPTAAYNLGVTVVDTGILYSTSNFHLMHYSVGLAPCCQQLSGWASIRATDGDTCVFACGNSLSGDRTSLQWDESYATWTSNPFDLAFCLTGNYAGLSGACCDPGNNCTPGMTEYQCLAMCGTWHAGVGCGTSTCLFEKGDVNCDQLTNMDDLPYFVAALIGGYTGCDISLADMDNSGTVDGLDIQGFVNALLGG